MSSYQLDFILRLMAARAASDPALRMQQPWQAAWEQDYAWFGEAVTQHYRGDDSALRVLLGGSRWRKFAFRAQLTSPPSHALHGHRTSLQPQTHGARACITIEIIRSSLTIDLTRGCSRLQ